MIPFIQRVTSRSSPSRARGSARRSSGLTSSTSCLDRQRGDVVVGGHALGRSALGGDRDARDAAALAVDPDDRRGEPERHAEAVRGARPTGAIHASFAGALSTRSAAPPWRVRSKSSCSRM